MAAVFTNCFRAPVKEDSVKEPEKFNINTECPEPNMWIMDLVGADEKLKAQVAQEWKDTPDKPMCPGFVR